MYKLKFHSTTRYPLEDKIPAIANEAMENDQKVNRQTTVVLLKPARGEKPVVVSSSYPWEEIATATVTRYFKDPDIPVLGQKCALEKLIKEGKFNRKQRIKIWETFWAYSPKTESLRHGAYKEEIKNIKVGDWWRGYAKEMRTRRNKVIKEI